jgi:hypothetical protein
MSGLLWNAWLKKGQTNKAVPSDDKKLVERALNMVDHDDGRFTEGLSWHSVDKPNHAYSLFQYGSQMYGNLRPGEKNCTRNRHPQQCANKLTAVDYMHIRE